MAKRFKYLCMMALLFGAVATKAEALDNCNFFDYECCEPATICGCIGITPKIGFAPGIYYGRTDRHVEYASVDFASTSVAIDGAVQTELEIIQKETSFPNFHDQFEYPWQVGVEFSYAVSDCAEMFVDLNYTQARGKTHKYDIHTTLRFPDLSVPEVLEFPIVDEFHEDYDDLKEWSGYIGCRYFSPRYCRAAFFIGSKVGVRYRNAVGYRLKIREKTVNSPSTELEEVTDLVDKGKHEFYGDNLVVSAGLQLGVDYRVSECCSIFLTAEAVGSGCFKMRDYDDKRSVYVGIGEDQKTFVTDRHICNGNIGTVINFPITFGTRLYF